MNQQTPDLEAVKAKAESGDVEAQRSLAHYYHYNCAPDQPEETLKWSSMAAENKNPEGMYIYGLILIETYSPSKMLRGYDFIQSSAKTNYMPAIEYLACIYVDGLFFHDDCYEKHYLIHPDYKKAIELSKSYYNESPYVSYIYAKLILEGKGHIKNEKKAFRLMQNSARYSCHYAIHELPYMFKYGIGTEVNYIDAYIWSLISDLIRSNQGNTDEEIDLYAENLSKQEIWDAQDEAERRFNIMKERPLTENDSAHIDTVVTNEVEEEIIRTLDTGKSVAEKINDREESQVEPYSQTTECAHDKEIRSKLRALNVEHIEQLEVVYFMATDKITFIYNGKKQTVAVGRRDCIVSKRFVALIEACYRYNNNELRIEYWGKTISDLAQSKSANYAIVNYVNSEIRKLFGLGMDARAFGFVGKGKNKNFRYYIKAIEVR